MHNGGTAQFLQNPAHEVTLEPESSVRVTNEVRRVTEVLADITGLRSQWKGLVVLDEQLDARGKKPFSCEIVLRADLCAIDERWRTVIHESLHGFSEGYRPADYLAHRGWEEGVVEQLQRLLRPEVLSRLDVKVDERVNEAIEVAHPFNRYIEALESMRLELGQVDRDFYMALLAVPIAARYNRVVQWSMELTIDHRKRVLLQVSKGAAILDGRFGSHELRR